MLLNVCLYILSCNSSLAYCCLSSTSITHLNFLEPQRCLPSPIWKFLHVLTQLEFILPVNLAHDLFCLWLWFRLLTGCSLDVSQLQRVHSSFLTSVFPLSLCFLSSTKLEYASRTHVTLLPENAWGNWCGIWGWDCRGTFPYVALYVVLGHLGGILWRTVGMDLGAVHTVFWWHYSKCQAPRWVHREQLP